MRRPIYQRLYVRVLLFMACTSGVTLAFEGCNQDVATTLLGGLNTLSKTLIDAFFVSITPTTTTPVTTVQAITDAVAAMLA